MQTIINAIFPPQCVGCDDQVDTPLGLCPACWPRFQFITGALCDTCGQNLPGSVAEPGLICQDCMTIERPWARGRSVFQYADGGREFVLKLKHADRLDLAPAAAKWLGDAAGDILAPDTVFVPVPLHPWRLMRRKYNQSAVLVQKLAAYTGRGACVDALTRTRATKSLDGLSKDERFTELDGAITLTPKRAGALAGRSVTVVDDVMTSGATLAACANAVLQADPKTVTVLSLARVGKDT